MSVNMYHARIKISLHFRKKTHASNLDLVTKLNCSSIRIWHQSDVHWHSGGGSCWDPWDCCGCGWGACWCCDCCCCCEWWLSCAGAFWKCCCWVAIGGCFGGDWSTSCFILDCFSGGSSWSIAEQPCPLSFDSSGSTFEKKRYIIKQIPCMEVGNLTPTFLPHKYNSSYQRYTVAFKSYILCPSFLTLWFTWVTKTEFLLTISNTISRRQVMRIKENINKGLLVDP